MAIAREETLCLTCHDGSPAAKNVSGDFTKTVHHPVVNTDTLRRTGSWTGWDGVTRTQRTVECDDCHNPHAAQIGAHSYSTTATSTRNQISNPLKKVSGVQFNYTGLANWPTYASSWYTAIPYSTGVTYEYQICFKCHSSYFWTTGTPPNGLSANGSAANPVETDVAREFNPNNRSGHPVVTGLDNYPNSTAVGSPLKKGLQAAVLIAPWANNIGQQTMMCSDCHNTDASSTAAQGPHGSAVQFMLRPPNSANWPNVNLSARGTSWCANCHPLGTTTNNVHTKSNHTNYPCYRCHIVIPHGGKLSRLMADNDTMPARYAYNNTLNTSYVRSFNKKARTGYTESDCQAGCTGAHSAAAGENW